jgi:putative transposase
MRKSRFSDQQIALVLQQVEHGASVAEVCRKLGIAEQTYYRWKKKFGEMAPSEIVKLKQLEDENRRLKGLVADLTLDKQMLHEKCCEKKD